MPTFPTYDGELPKCLNPLNPRHYLLVLYWVFFRPTALKCYLYQASPEIYRSQSGWKSFSYEIQNPSCRNIFLISIILPFFFSLTITATIYLLCCQLYPDLIGFRIPHFLRLLESTMQTVAKGMVIGIGSGLASGVGSGLAIGVGRGTAFGIAFGMTSGLVFGKLLGFLFGMVFAVASGVVIAVIGVVGTLFLPFYLLESSNLLVPKRLRKFYPLVWDELGLLPLAQTQKYLASQLRRSPETGLKYLAAVIANPFQAWAVQSAAWSYLEQSESPIEQIYIWATSKELDRYAQIPVAPIDWALNVSAQEMLFAELADLPITPQGKGRYGLNAIPYILTQPLRYKTPIAYRYETHMPLWHLMVLFGRIKLSEEFELELDTPEPEITHYPYGLEVRESLSAIFDWLTLQTFSEIAQASKCLTWLNPTDTFLRPTVIQALQILSTVSRSVHRANIASSPINQRNAILIANDSLEQLTTYVTEQVHPNYPEQKLLLCIIDQWQSIITKAGGELGRAELLEPIENPYIAGPPVTGPLFIGREDILTQLEELWLKPGQVESVVIFGHRRMGKTSILRNLPGRLTPTTHIINFNIQTLGTLNTQQLILALAQTLYDDLPAHIHIPEPQSTDFPTPEPDFRRWLKKLETHRQPDDRFIIAIDEFELIEQGIKDGRLSPSLIGHWRGILNDFPWIIFAFAGLHTLQEMTQDYWNPLFGSVRKIPITFLTQPAATRLITNPSEDFPIDYEPDAIDRIYRLTHGQPYLTQLICQNLITRFNRQRFEEQREIEPRFTIDDVNTIINEPNFFNDGNAYFRGIWEQAQETQGPAQLAILQNLVNDRLEETELADRTHLTPDTLNEALNLLITHDVIHLDAQNNYHYRVELMRQWVSRSASLQSPSSTSTNTPE